ncbi:MAG: hypothetical protein HIU83_15855 [Proteobacteria bacterium]|nr:hypothetical protein [Pseudomonadota bacterium]
MERKLTLRILICSLYGDRTAGQFTFVDQVDEELTDLLIGQRIRLTMEMLCKCLNGIVVTLNGFIGIPAEQQILRHPSS